MRSLLLCPLCCVHRRHSYAVTLTDLHQAQQPIREQECPSAVAAAHESDGGRKRRALRPSLCHPGRSKRCSVMSFKAWLVLLIIYILYLLIGGFAFRAIELPEFCNDDNRNFSAEAYAEDVLTIDVIEDADNARDVHWSLDLGKANIEDEICAKWNLYNSIFFSFTAVTTIGYGHLSPSTKGGKILCIFYSLLGVPINGILVGTLGTLFGTWLKRFTVSKSETASEGKRYLLIFVDVLLFMVPGTLIFLVGPSFAFWQIEQDWTYLDSFYYAFITLTTIGFGDFVAGRDLEVLDDMGGWQEVYEICLIVWIIFGLGYIFMIITVIADGLKKPGRVAAKRFRAAQDNMVQKILEEIAKKKQNKKESYTGMESANLIRPESEPQLNSIDSVMESDSDLRKAKSETQMDALDGQIPTIVEQGEFPASQSTIAVSQQTILSLRNFIDVAKSTPSTSESRLNVPKHPRRAASMQHPSNFVTSQMTPSGADSSIPINMDLLKTTTMAEFIEAVAKVEKEEQERNSVADLLSPPEPADPRPKATRKISLLHLPSAFEARRARSKSTVVPPSHLHSSPGSSAGRPVTGSVSSMEQAN